VPESARKGARDGQVRESLTAGVYVEGLREVEVMTVDDALALMRRGAAHRHTAETRMNRESSRSHSVFTAVMTSQSTDEHGVHLTRNARLHLVRRTPSRLFGA